MIIFGTTTTKKLLDKGEFGCPQCQEMTPYEKRRVKQWGHLYWIPLIPMQEMPPYVECKKCRNTYIERVLDQQPGETFQAEFERAAGLIMAKMALADGVIDESEIDTIKDVYSQITNSNVERDVVLKLIEAARTMPENANDIAQSFSSSLNADGQELVMKAILLVAFADGDFAEEEQKMVAEIGAELGMSKAHVKGVFAEMTDPD